MPYTKPTLSTLVEDSGQSIMTRVFGAARAAPLQSVARALGTVIGAGLYGVYGFVSYLFLQALPDTATGTFLERWAAIWSITRSAGDPAIGTLDLTGTPTTVLSAGATFQATNGQQYTTDADATIGGGGTITVAVTAVTNGDAGNLVAGETVTLTSPVAGIDSAATVATGGLTGGADAETDERLRQRLLQRIQNPPQGGTAADYEAWALAANTSVTRVTVAGAYPSAGNVTIWPLVDDGAGAVTPSAGVLSDVDTYIQARRPVTATATVTAPTESTLAISVAISPDTAALRTAVEASITAMFASRNAVETDASGTPTGILYKSWINDAVGDTNGINTYTVSVPAGDTAPANGTIVTKGTVTFV